MAEDLRSAKTLLDSGALAPVRPMTRLIVLPFRVLRQDPETDFLAFSLSDALTTSLSGLDSLVVRSSLAASRFAGETFDLETIAAKADVDAVLTGTLLRAQDQLRVTAQLVESPHGTVRWSHTAQVTLGDIFTLQDTLTKRIVESLSVPLSARDERMLKRDVPASARAYEFYLRANQIAYEAKHWTVARDLYLQCLEEDSEYAPAWARLGRIYRVIAMYSDEGSQENYGLAEDAFRRALELNPDLSIAHNHFTLIELETGRARQAMARLLDRVRLQSADPELFAGLVQACRYAGLQEPAITAYEHARRLDPHIRTAVSHVYLMTGSYEQAIQTDVDDPPYLTALALDLLGRRGEAIEHVNRHMSGGMPRMFRLFFEATKEVLEGRLEAARRIGDEVLSLWRLRDPCATFYLARTLALGEHPDAIRMFRRAVEGGFHAYSFYLQDPWLDSLRGDPTFDEILRFAQARVQEAGEAFAASGGERILGPLAHSLTT
jgi:TolB-like protein/tetratricopeptide (TPR) repeat protein